MQITEWILEHYLNLIDLIMQVSRYKGLQQCNLRNTLFLIKQEEKLQKEIKEMK